MLNVAVEIHLALKYGSHSVDFHENRDCPTTFCKELLYRMGSVIGRR